MIEPPSHTRDFFDPAKLNELIRKHVLEGFQKKLNQIETADHKLQVGPLELGKVNFSLDDQKRAVLDKHDLTVPVKGTVSLVDKRSGKIVESKNVTVANIPHVTERNTVIYNGSEYEPIHQQRLLPGIYSRIRQSGEAEAHINPAPRTGVSARILFLPDQELFILMIQNTQIRLYGILHDLGINDNQMIAAWGHEIYLKNKSQYRGDEIDKLYAKLFNL